MIQLRPVLPHSHYFHSGVIGSGMCLFSCSPLTSVQYYPWSINGTPHKVHHGDWWGGKGLGGATTKFQGCNFALATTHVSLVYQSQFYFESLLIYYQSKYSQLIDILYFLHSSCMLSMTQRKMVTFITELSKPLSPHKFSSGYCLQITILYLVVTSMLTFRMFPTNYSDTMQFLRILLWRLQIK